MSSQSSNGCLRENLADRIAEDIKPETRTYVRARALLGYFVRSVAKNRETADTDALIQTVLGYTTEVYKSPEFEQGRKYLAQYRGPLSKESDGYETLANCLNEAFRVLETKPMPELREVTPGLGKLHVHANGEKNITHKYPLRSDKPVSLRPDLCIINEQLHTTLAERENDDEITLEWRHIQLAADLKRTLNTEFSAIRDIDEGPQSVYNIPDYYVLPDGPWTGRTGGSSYASERYIVPMDSAPDTAFGRPNNSPELDLDVSNTSSVSISDSPAPHKLPPNQQVGLYGMEMLNRGIYTLHTMNLVIVDDLVWIWMHDRQNVVQSTGINFVRNMPYFMVLLAVMQRFKLDDWGIVESLVPKDMFIDPDALKNPVDIYFGEMNEYKVRIIHPEADNLRVRGPLMKGRATALLDATSLFKIFKGQDEHLEILDEQFVIKASCPEEQRCNEAEIANMAKSLLQDFGNNLPDVVTSGDFGNTRKLDDALKEGRATALLEATLFKIFEGQEDHLEILDKQFIIKASWPDEQRHNEVIIAQMANTRLLELKNNLPDVVTSGDFGNTRKLDDALKDLGAKRNRTTFPRVLRLIVCGRLEPLYKISDQETFMKVWVGCLICHYGLWQNGILHGDISVWNLMVRRVSTSNGKTEVYGVVNDFDLSILLDDKGQKQFPGGQHMGTLPFMARDCFTIKFLEGEGVRKYLHDFECFVWVLAWLCLRNYPESLGRLEWRTGSFSSIRGAKIDFVEGGFNKIKDRKVQYPNAWRKCKMLFEVLRVHDKYKESLVDIENMGKTPVDMFGEALKIMRDNTYDLNAFENMILGMLTSVWSERVAHICRLEILQ